MGLTVLKHTLVDPEFNLRVTTGSLPGYDVIDKFGANLLITAASDPEDIWDAGGIYNFTTNGGTDYFVSSSNVGDTQNTRFSVLTVDSNGNWNDETFIQAIAGQTKTQLTPPSGDPIVRIYKIQNAGARGDNYLGDIYVYEDSTVTGGIPDDTSLIRAKVLIGNDQTSMALYTVPTGKVGFLYRGELGMEFTGSQGSGTNFATFNYQSARFDEVFTVKKTISCINQADSNYQDSRGFPDPIPAKTDIKLTCKEVSDDMGVWGTMCILLIDEDKFTDEYLTAIGQIRKVV